MLERQTSLLEPIQGHRIRPAATVYYTMLYALFGFKTFGYQMARLFFLAIASLLVLFYSRRFFRDNFSSFACGLLFASLYSHYEIALWFTPSYMSLCISFMLLTLIAYDRFLEKKSFGGVWPLTMIAAVAFHESALALPLLMVGAGLTHPRKVSWGRVLLSSLVALGLCLTYAFLSWSSLNPVKPAWGIKTLMAFMVPFAEHAANLFGASHLYPPYRQAIDHHWQAVRWLLPLRGFIVFSLVVLFARFRRSYVPAKPLLFGLLVTLSTLAPPVLTFGENYQMSMRYLFVPSLGSVFIAVTILSLFWSSDKKSRFLATTCLVAMVAVNIVRLQFVQDFYLQSAKQFQQLLDDVVKCCGKRAKEIVLFSENPSSDIPFSESIMRMLRLYGLPVKRVKIFSLSELKSGQMTCRSPARFIQCHALSSDDSLVASSIQPVVPRTSFDLFFDLR